MAALAALGPRRDTRGPASAVDLLARLGRSLPAPEPAKPPERTPLWEAVEPSGDAIVDLRRELQAARAAGVEFDQAWRVARGRVSARITMAGKYRGERGQFLDATGGTREAWRAAYERTGERLFSVEQLRGLASPE